MTPSEPASRLAQRFRLAARLSAAATLAVGALVLAGWLFHVRALMQVVPGAIAMVPNTAVGFLLAGFSLWLKAGRHAESRRRASRTAAGAAGVLGLIVLAQYILRADFGIDELLFRDPSGLTSAFPGRMAISTALAFIAIAGALLLSDLPRTRWVTEALALVPGLLALLSLTGYAYGVHSLYWIGSYKGMAIHAALGFLFLTFGTLFARPDGPISGLILSESIGGVMVRRLLPFAIAIPIVLGGLEMRGRRAELYQGQYGVALLVVATIVFIGAVVAWQGAALERVDRDRHRAARYARSLLEASLDPLVTISPEGKITDVNEATVSATGVSRGALIGSRFSDYFTEPEKADEGYKLVLSKGEVRDYPLTLRDASGRSIDVLYNATTYRDDAGAVHGVFAAARDVTARKEAGRYARSLLEASLDPLVTISAEGTVTDVNEATIKVTGVPREKLVGTDFSDYFTEPERARQGYRQVFARGSVTDYPLTIRHRDGLLTDVLYNATVYRDADGNVLGVFAAARDVTERNRAEEEVRRLNAGLEQRVAERTADLEAVNKELEAFSYSVSHDLRAPLRSIDGFSQVLQEDFGDKLGADGEDALGRIRGAARHMGQLIDDLLKLSKVTRAELHRERVDLSEMARSVALDLSRREPGRQAEVHIADGAVVEADPRLLRIVIENLMDNAFKFTSRKADARIDFGTQEDEGRAVYFVRDNGVGFDMAYAGKLFGAFQRLHSTVEFPGTGIGLATVQRIVHRHGGSVRAEGVPGEGATFSFTL